MMTRLDRVPLHDAKGAVRAVIETPRGSTVKLAYDPKLSVFTLSRALVLGVSFPYDWGFLPSTLAEDGDPLDVLVVHDGATHPGVVIAASPVGIVYVTETEDGEKHQNDRIIAIPVGAVRDAAEHRVSERLREELEHFFLAATRLAGKQVKVGGWGDAREAAKAIGSCAERFRRRARKR
jgi:inorganic pyrophosphatase